MRGKLGEILDIYEKRAKEFYPGLCFGQSRSMYNGDEPRSCEYEFSFRAKNLIKTEYVPKKFELIHYTPSLQTLLEILNSGCIRLSNLISLNDPQELSFIINNLKMDFNEKQISDLKKNLFSSSFCEVSDPLKPDEFDMWRLYGGDGYGAAIVFEIVNRKANWLNFILAKVQYGDVSSVKRFKDFIEFHYSFQKENNYPIHNFPVVLSSLMALHKNEIWKQEKEVRLLTHQDFNEYTLDKRDIHICQLKHSISRHGTKYSYLELPIVGGKEYKRLSSFFKDGHERFLNDSFPTIKIKSVIMGYRNAYETIHNVSELVYYLSNKENYNYHIPVNQSHLRNHMV